MSEPYRAIADSTRRAILDALAERERSVGDLCELFHVSQPAVSQHLKVLRESGLVRVESRGRHRFYALEPGPLREVHDWVGHYERFWNAKLDVLGRVLDRESKRGKRS
jgi:DNA-binding transcriptional ArsR family regulator